jgi:RNA polymerase sigma-70 factor (ECF subfamily)
LPDRTRFEALALPHLNAAFNLARWLTRNEQDAQDVVQEAYLRALRFFAGFQGDDARAWLLAIVRNACFDWLARNRRGDWVSDEEVGLDNLDVEQDNRHDPVAQAIARADAQLLQQAIEALPAAFREALVLREIEELSYKEIAVIAAVPVGTVMSRLARARALLRTELMARQGEEHEPGRQ